MSQEVYRYAAVYRGKVYDMGCVAYETTELTYGDVMRKIAAGYRRIAESFEFDAIRHEFEETTEGEEHDGTDDAPGG